jgi:transcriptional regulator with XRE-family HTH domain
LFPCRALASFHVMLTGTSPKAAGARLRLIRELKGWTVTYLAERLMGTSRQNLSNWEAAQDGRFIPVPWLLQFCLVTGATPDWVLIGDPSGIKGPLYAEVVKAVRAETGEVEDPPRNSDKKAV